MAVINQLINITDGFIVQEIFYKKIFKPIITPFRIDKQQFFFCYKTRHQEKKQSSEFTFNDIVFQQETTWMNR